MSVALHPLIIRCLFVALLGMSIATRDNGNVP